MPTEQIYRGTFAFTDALRRQGECDLQLYQLDSGAYVAIATDTDQGPSITNAAEELASQVRRRFLGEGDALLWVEHYRQRRESEVETYDKVMMRWDGRRYVEPTWKYTTKDEVERLIGRRLEP